MNFDQSERLTHRLTGDIAEGKTSTVLVGPKLSRAIAPLRNESTPATKDFMPVLNYGAGFGSAKLLQVVFCYRDAARKLAAPFASDVTDLDQRAAGTVMFLAANDDDLALARQVKENDGFIVLVGHEGSEELEAMANLAVDDLDAAAKLICRSHRSANHNFHASRRCFEPIGRTGLTANDAGVGASIRERGLSFVHPQGDSMGLI